MQLHSQYACKKDLGVLLLICYALDMKLILSIATAIAAVLTSLNAYADYSKPKKEMPAETYILFRSLERLMAANNVNRPITVYPISITNEDCRHIFKNQDSRFCEYVEMLGDRVAKSSTNLSEIDMALLREMATPNAYALSETREIRFITKMIKNYFHNPEVITAIMAHELAHIELYHSQAYIKKRMEASQDFHDEIEAIFRRAKRLQFWQQFGEGFLIGMNNSYGSIGAELDNQQLYEYIAKDSSFSQETIVKWYIAIGSFPAFNFNQYLKGIKRDSILGGIISDVNGVRVRLDEKLDEYSRLLEQEADVSAVSYLSKACLNPEALAKWSAEMALTHGYREQQDSGTHPTSIQRVGYIQDAIKKQHKLNRSPKNAQCPKKFPQLVYKYDKTIGRVTIYPQASRRSGSIDPAKNIESILGN